MRSRPFPLPTIPSPARHFASLALMIAATLAPEQPASGADAEGASLVRLERLPEGALQPQVATDSAGRVHLVYFLGDPKAGDLFHRQRTAPDGPWSAPLRINSTPGSAIALGTIRGPQIAIGRGDRVHVAWNGSPSSTPRTNAGPAHGSPMLYTRLNDSRTAFEPQRNLMSRSRHLDGGGSVAADDSGHVHVVFHANRVEDTGTEADRVVLVATSNDDGKTFLPESPATAERTGACSCCALKAVASGPGRLHIAFRGAREKIHRDMLHLTSTDAGKTFALSRLGSWEGTTCPMSTTAVTPDPDGTHLRMAWEIGSQLSLGALHLSSGRTLLPVTPSGTAKRRHPALASHRSGHQLLAWTEGTGWNKGGSIAWQVFGPDLRPVGPPGRANGLPAWTFPAVYAAADGRFVLLH